MLLTGTSHGTDGFRCSSLSELAHVSNSAVPFDLTAPMRVRTEHRKAKHPGLHVDKKVPGSNRLLRPAQGEFVTSPINT